MAVPTVKRTVGRAGGALAALVAVSALFGAQATAQDAPRGESLSAELQNEPTPDPAIAEGLSVFDTMGTEIGKLEEVIIRENQQFAVLMIERSPTGTARKVTVPYETLSVVDGLVTFAEQ